MTSACVLRFLNSYFSLASKVYPPFISENTLLQNLTVLYPINNQLPETCNNMADKIRFLIG